MKIPQPTASYAHEHSCIEEVMAIAKKIVRRKEGPTDQHSRRGDATQRSTKAQIGML